MDADTITNISQPSFFGTADPFSDVTLLVATAGTSNFTVAGQTQADSSSEWSITTSLLADGKYTVEAQAMNQAGLTTATTQILPNSTQGPLTIDTVGPKITALELDRLDGQVDLTLQDNLSGMDQAEVMNTANYQLTKLPHEFSGTYIVNVISATPDGPTGPRTWS